MSGWLFAIPGSSHAIFGDGGSGFMQLEQLARIIKDNAKRYRQLKAIIKTGKENREHLRNINAGIENIVVSVESLPLKDRKILHKMKDFHTAYNSLLEIYGDIPKGGDQTMYRLNDETVAESVAMVGDIHTYASGQEKNAALTAGRVGEASLKGAARMNAHTNTQILHTLNQLLKVNGQMLKLQSENLAMANKKEKDMAGGRRRIDRDIATGFKKLSRVNKDFKIPVFN